MTWCDEIKHHPAPPGRRTACGRVGNMWATFRLADTLAEVTCPECKRTPLFRRAVT